MVQITGEQKQLITDNHNLIYSFLQKRSLDIEDYYDLAAIGLCKAAKTFEKDKSAFSTYAFCCMFNEVMHHKRKMKAAMRIGQSELIYYDNTENNEDGSSSLFDRIHCNTDTEDKIILSLDIERSLKNMNEKEMIILLMSTQGYKQIQIAKQVKITQAGVSRIKKRAIEKLKIY